MKLRFLKSKTSIKETINDEDLEFFSARPAVVAQFEVLANDLVKAIQVVFRDDEKLRGSTHSVDRRGQRKGEQAGASGWASENISTTTMPIDPEVLAATDAKSAEAVSQLIRSLLSDESRLALGSLIVSSLRDIYDASKETGMPLEEDVQTLCAECDLETFVALASSAIRANWKGLAAGFRMTLPKKADGLLKKGEQVLDGVLNKLATTSPSLSEDSSIEPVSISSDPESPESQS